MKRTLALATCVMALCWAAPVRAHLCNDVFQQAKDNLAVKVDIRDGQLRVGKEASFHVYLLNTMDRDIANINLEVRSSQFDAEVKPSPQWRSFPALKTNKRGGKKEWFEVTLARKRGVRDGRYQIQLHLFNARNRRQVFKTVDIDAAVGAYDLPVVDDIIIDGRGGRNEWRSSVLCSDFYNYVRSGRYFENRPAREQSRFRLACDQDNLYVLFNAQGGARAKSDRMTLYVASATDATPVAVSVDRISGRVSGIDDPGAVEVKTSDRKNAVEVRIPRALLGIGGVDSFYANVTRTLRLGGDELVSYWRGNKFSVMDPIVYGQFKITD